MQYHIDTIPVWEAMEAHGECPVCLIRRKLESDLVERTLGGSVMEPEARIQVNERGVCAEHSRQLAALQNKLGHALLMDSHAKEQLSRLEKAEKLIPAAKAGFGRKPSLEPLIAELTALSARCVVCESLEEHMGRYLYTFVHLWKTEKKFREALAASKGLCAPHTAAVLTEAGKRLSAGSQRELAAELMRLLRQSLTVDEKDLEWFTLKFDYRNQAKPWGDSKTALERTVNRLRGWCLGDDPGKSKD